MGVVPLIKALTISREKGVDIVEVAPTAEPPVCRLMDYGKFKYEMAKKEKEARRGQKAIIVRDLRLRPKINEHDLGNKVTMVKKFLAEGNKVKVSMRFRGREAAHPELGLKVLKTLSLALKDVGTLEAPPSVGSNEMSILIQPLPSLKKPSEKAAQAKPEDKLVKAKPEGKPVQAKQETGPAQVKQGAKPIQIIKEVNA